MHRAKVKLRPGRGLRPIAVYAKKASSMHAWGDFFAYTAAWLIATAEILSWSTAERDGLL